jgi:FdhD protein
MNGSVKDCYALKWRAGKLSRELDHLAAEEPLEIRLGGQRFTLTMRTPGHDEELTAGFLLAEGFITSRAELGQIRRLRDSRGRPEPNALDVILNIPAEGLRERLRRNFNISSSCGVCGKSSIEALERRISPLSSKARIGIDALFRMPVMMREAQTAFSLTGGLHAAALFKLVPEAIAIGTLGPLWSTSDPITASDPVQAQYGPSKLELTVLREDVGRHNAVDKVNGYALLTERLPLSSSALMVSGRLSFEIVQKAASAGIEILCAVSAPSSLAVELAAELGMTLIGFVREPNFNVYTGPERIVY